MLDCWCSENIFKKESLSGNISGQRLLLLALCSFRAGNLTAGYNILTGKWEFGKMQARIMLSGYLHGGDLSFYQSFVVHRPCRLQ